MPRKSGIRLDEDEFAELVGNIYDAAIDPSAWHRVLSELRDATHSSCANLLGVHHENTEVALLADVDVDCQSASKIDPLSACNIDPLSGTAEVVPVVNRGDPSGFV